MILKLNPAFTSLIISPFFRFFNTILVNLFLFALSPIPNYPFLLSPHPYNSILFSAPSNTSKKLWLLPPIKCKIFFISDGSYALVNLFLCSQSPVPSAPSELYPAENKQPFSVKMYERDPQQLISLIASPASSNFSMSFT